MVISSVGKTGTNKMPNRQAVDVQTLACWFKQRLYVFDTAAARL